MSKPALKRLEELFHEAASLAPARRLEFLDAACGDDAQLRAAVEELLRHDQVEGADADFLTSPVADAAQRVRAETPTLRIGQQSVQRHASFPTIPGYEILEELGRGGMGIVYKARHADLDRIVALKMLPPGAQVEADVLTRFRIEAEALARLHHPNVVPIYDIGDAAGIPYFTMEFIAGPNLGKVLSGRPQDPRAAAELVEVIARAVHAVHQCGIIHRDLKPANILLQVGDGQSPDAGSQASILEYRSATPKITDFGLAKAQTEHGRLTQTGVTMGTPSYMAPEQASVHGSAGPGADIYALGTVLFESLTGRPPFDGDTPAETITQVLHDEPISPVKLRPRLPRDLVTICLKCLEKSPARRYGTALELAEDLARFRAGETICARPVGPLERTYRWCRRQPLVAGLMAACGLLIIAMFVTVLIYNRRLEHALAGAEGQTETQRRQIIELNITIGARELDHGDTLTAILRFSEALRLDEDVPEKTKPHRERIEAALKLSPKLLQLQVLSEPALGAGRAGSTFTVATSDKNGSVRVWDAMTGLRIGVDLRLGHEPIHADFGLGGKSLATVHPGFTIHLCDAESGACKRIVSGQSGIILAVLSDNLLWLLTVSDAGIGQVWNASTGAPKGAPLKLDGKFDMAAVSADGERVALVADSAVRIWDVAAAGWRGAPIAEKSRVEQILLSFDGETLVDICKDHFVDVWNLRRGERISTVSLQDDIAAHARLSSDGRLLLAGNLKHGPRVWDLIAGTPLTPFLAHDGPLAAAEFGSDGKSVVTVCSNGTVRVWDISGCLDPAKAQPPTVSGRSAADLVALAQVLAGRRINERQEHQILESDQLRSAWELVREKN